MGNYCGGRSVEVGLFALCGLQRKFKLVLSLTTPLHPASYAPLYKTSTDFRIFGFYSIFKKGTAIWEIIVEGGVWRWVSLHCADFTGSLN
jgi:hypothetical protein